MKKLGIDIDRIVTAVLKSQYENKPTPEQKEFAIKAADKWLQVMFGDENSEGICTGALGSFIEHRIRPRYAELAENIKSLKRSIPVKSNNSEGTENDNRISVSEDLVYIG